MKRLFFLKKSIWFAGLLAFITVFTIQNAFCTSTRQETVSTGSEVKPEKEFNTTDMVMEHVLNHYSWHIFGDKYLYLPVVLFTDKGLDLFSSEKIETGNKIYEGHYTYKLINDKINIVNSQGIADPVLTKKIWNFSITKNVASLFLSIFLLLIILIPAGAASRKRLNKVPKGMQSALEPFIVFIRDEVAVPNMGHNATRFMPFLLTIFFFVWINNLLGLIPFFPGGANLSGNISFTFALAFITLVLTLFNAKKPYWKHIFTPDVPILMYVIMVPVELIGIITKPIALTIRLFANITAGHVLILSLISLIFIFKTAWLATASIPFTLFISLIELLVGLIQAFIFTALAALYIGTAVNEHVEH